MPATTRKAPNSGYWDHVMPPPLPSNLLSPIALAPFRAPNSRRTQHWVPYAPAVEGLRERRGTCADADRAADQHDGPACRARGPGREDDARLRGSAAAAGARVRGIERRPASARLW